MECMPLRRNTASMGFISLVKVLGAADKREASELEHCFLLDEPEIVLMVWVYWGGKMPRHPSGLPL